MRNIPVIFLFSFTAVSSLSDLFYPHGTEKGDKVNPVADDVSSPAIELKSPFSFFGHTYSQIYVNNNGDLTFKLELTAYVPKPFVADGTTTIIAPLWTDLDNRKEGVISHNQYSEGSVLLRATQDINQYFPKVNFTASWVFVATWDGVPYYNQQGKASFQVVLISRGTLSFMLINYGPIDPTTHEVQAGYVTFKHSFEITSTNSNVSKLSSTSNVNVPGRWAFLVNQGSSYTTTSDLNIKVSEACKANASQECTKTLLSKIDNITTEVLSKEVVEDKLKFLTTQQNSLLVGKTNQDELISSFNNVLRATDKLMSTLVKKVETISSVSISLETLEARVTEVGPSCSMMEIPQLDTSENKMDIDLIGISKSEMNQGHAAVAFMSYTNMSNSSLFSTTISTIKLLSTVVSATLPRTRNTSLTKPVNFTLKHTAEFNLSGTPSCVYWKETDWVTDGCTLIETNSTHSVCSCDHLSTFALIMQTKPSELQNDHRLDVFSMVAETLGLVFLVLTLLTFALCRKNPRVINTARIQLCISLLLAHFLFLLTQILLKSKSLQPHKLACAVMAGVLHFLFLSAFVWMFIEALMLFIAVKNLSRPKSKQRNFLNWKLLTVVGYMIALFVVGVSAAVVPEGYGSEQCWLKQDKDLKWSFLGPVSFILASNTILFSLIAFSLGYSLAHLNSQVSQIKQTRTVFFKTMAQFIILGCPWVLGFFTADSKALEIIFVILISQQGTFIFIVHCVLSNEVKQKYRKLLGGFQVNFSPTIITETSTTQG
ncbi:adhesion G protein-coupled receptor E3-like [Pygocentrus nattereri]|uniref:adhesion G protein-coupled receptor E3-like n=1 Tax=Pygocentrus nattereri TaxID=42514 RepID=UPI0018910967|nr:adhesion G protein-coupled receptor E3-like [Pygocentrus nattereri]